jgi:FlaA1/EpsC-like NDP-sugar epimerase
MRALTPSPCLFHDAAKLVLQAGLMGKGGEIFVLDMGGRDQ